MRTRGADSTPSPLGRLLGSVDWDSLVTRQDEHYESASSILASREPELRSERDRQPSSGSNFQHPALQKPGWWRRPSRLREQLADVA